jgi:hypothetical protein
MKSARPTSNRTKAPGLPASILFRHLRNPPGGKVSEEFLVNNAWWWRKSNAELLVWLKCQTDFWPRCPLYEFFKNYQPNQMPRSGEDARGRFLELWNRVGSKCPELKLQIAQFWDQEFDAAKGYEREARDKGDYLCGAPYNQLTQAQRKEWLDKYWQLNLNSTPACWIKGESPPHDFDTDKLTSLFHVQLGHFASGASVSVRFNLRHGNGYLAKAFKNLIIEERNRLHISDTEELRRKDPARIREFKQFVTKERQRLGIPNPKHEGTDRRPLNRSWADIENIDVKTHCNQITTSRTRQRESVTRRKLLSAHERQRQIADWKLTVLQ